MATGYAAGAAPWPSTLTRAFDRSRILSLSDGRISSGDPDRIGDSAIVPPSLSFGSTPMHMSYSTESHLHPRKRASRSPPYALPPLKSLVNEIDRYGGAAEAEEIHPRHLPRPPGMDRKASSTQGIRIRRASHASGMPDRYSSHPKAILSKIYANSIALADYAQDTQHTSEVPTPSEVDKMQQLASDLNLNLRDLQYRVDSTDSARPFEVISSKYDPPSVLQNGFQDREQRRRSSGGTSSVSFEMNTAHRRDSSGVWDPTDRRHSATYSRFNGRYPETDTSGYSDVSTANHSRYHESQDTSVTTEASKTSPSSYNSDVPRHQTTTEQSRPQKYRKRSRAAAPGSCLACNVEETPEWRNGPSGKRTLCNACGLHYSKMIRKKKNEAGGDASGIAVSIDELRASILLPATSANGGSDKGSIYG